jgi:hypothetical protein
VPAVRPIMADEDTPWVAEGEVLVENDRSPKVVASSPIDDRR